MGSGTTDEPAPSGVAETGTPPAAADRPGGRRERAILDAAARSFRERGYDRVGVDDIGQAAGISGPAIYRYFSGKDEILAALFDAAMDRLLLLCGQLPDDPEAALDRLIVAHVEFAVRDSALLAVYTREDRSLADPWRRRLQRRQRAHLDRWVASLSGIFPHRSADEHEAASHAAISTIHSVAEWPGSTRRAVDPAALLPRMVRAGLATLGDDPAARPPRAFRVDHDSCARGYDPDG